MSLFLVVSTLAFILAILFVRERWKGPLTLVAVLSNAIISSPAAISVLAGHVHTEILRGGLVFGDIPVRLDGLSAWFILLTNFTLITGIIYGLHYLKRHTGNTPLLTLHFIAYILNQFSLLGIFLVQNSLAFLCVWEISALTAFLLVIFEPGKAKTLRAGINYLVQSHLSVLLLTFAFIWMAVSAGSYDFAALGKNIPAISGATSLLIFLTLFAGFALKAGFVPFHTWLPHAHPAAPSHVSGVMSGVMIKAGIYGIMRMLLIIPINWLTAGYIILAVSVFSGLYGVMLATVQHNLKKLLAYHSIENIGIIGIGIGIGVIGTGIHQPFLAFAGYAGALLHTLNHSLFKSLLFFTSGNVYQATHTMILDRLGGLIKKMPHTAFLFLIAALAICGLPPFNGFVSEFLIFSGLFHGFAVEGIPPVVFLISTAALAMIGGLAMLCFTKAFGIAFLGNARTTPAKALEEAPFPALLPGYLIAGAIVIIGLFPSLFIRILYRPTVQFVPEATPDLFNMLTRLMQHISFASACLIGFILILYLVRYAFTGGHIAAKGPTWDCGYASRSAKLQYTATSYVRSYGKLLKPVFYPREKKDEITTLLPTNLQTQTHTDDRIETFLIHKPLRGYRRGLDRFRFLQNGSVQSYVLYGVFFIAISIAIPLVIRGIAFLFHLINQL